MTRKNVMVEQVAQEETVVLEGKAQKARMEYQVWPIRLLR